MTPVPLPPPPLGAVVLLLPQPTRPAPRNRARQTMLRIFFMETGPFTETNRGEQEIKFMGDWFYKLRAG